MGLGGSEIKRSAPAAARTQSDIAQEQKDDYSRRIRARQQTLLSVNNNAGLSAPAQKKTLLGG